MKLIFSLFAVSFFVACTSVNNQQRLDEYRSENIKQFQAYDEILEQQNNTIDSLRTLHTQLTDKFDTITTQLSSLNEKPKKTQKAPIAKTKVVAPLSIKKIDSAEKATLGRLEWIWVDLLNQYLKARIDTGAKSSSLHAKDILLFERDGKQWVRFHLFVDNHSQEVDDKTLYEAPLKRMVKIKQATLDGSEQRPVVSLKVKIGELYEEADFTLTDRTNMLYPALIGRSFLKDIALVDVAKVFTRKRDKKAAK